MSESQVLPAGIRTVTGTVMFRERIALPPGAVVTVRFNDVTRVEAPALVLAATAIPVEGQVPVPFSLSIDAADVAENALIGVWARLRSEVGTWQSDAAYPVLTRGAGDTAEVLVRRMETS